MLFYGAKLDYFQQNLQNYNYYVLGDVLGVSLSWSISCSSVLKDMTVWLLGEPDLI